MYSKTAFCGLDCGKCPAYAAAQTDDDRLRAETAETWSAEYKIEVNPEDINCDGCRSGSTRLISHCSVCEVRKCSLEKQVSNCAHCDEYACDRLNKFFAVVPQAKENLTIIRNSLLN